VKASRVSAYLVVFARTYVRNRIGLFFALIFPIILILLFGAIFSNTGSTTVALDVQNLDHGSPESLAFVQALNETGVFQVTMVSPTAGNLSGWLTANGDTQGLVIPDGFGADYSAHRPVNVTLYTDPAQASTAGIAEGAVQGVVNGFNLHAAGAGPVLGVAQANVGGTTYVYIDYLIPGLIGFSILVSPMFSMVNLSSLYKKQKLFRQLSLTPLTRGEWLLASILWFILLVLVSTVVMLAIGRGAFNADVYPTIRTLPFLFLGPVLFVSIGLLLGTVSTTPESAAVVGNLVTFPMMFLSGTFFPVSLFPTYLQTFARFLPLYYVIDGLNETMIFGNLRLAAIDLAVVAGLAVIFFVAATRAFRWQEE
jgi:ABC-2 type transport system permease protein